MQPSHSSNSSIYDSNPWRNLSDSAFASSQSSFTSSGVRDCLSRSSEEIIRNTQSPVRSTYRNNLHKEQPFSRPGSSLSRQSSTSNLNTEGSKNQVETEKIAQLVFLVKDVLDKVTKLDDNVDYSLTRLTESLDQKLGNSNIETQRYIKMLLENVVHEAQVSANEKARIVELENVIKEKNHQIANLENKLKNAVGQEIENIMSSLKTSITSELQTHLTLLHQMTMQMVKQNSISKLELECKMDRLLVINKEIIANEIDSMLKSHLPDFQNGFQAGNEKLINPLPFKTRTNRSTIDNIFEDRDKSEHCSHDSKRLTPHLLKVPQRFGRNSMKITTPRQLKSIKYTRHPRSLLNSSSKSKPVIWSYRGQCNSTQPSDVSFASESAESISEGSSPSYAVSMQQESPNAYIIDHFQSGLTF